MTVCVAVCVHDGIVFAADSATSLVGTDVPVEEPSTASDSDIGGETCSFIGVVPDGRETASARAGKN